MNIWKELKEVDKKFSWSFFGFIIGIIGIGIAIYTSYFYQNNPKIRFEIVTNTSIVDIKENIGNIDILYKGDSVSKKNKTLRIITIKVENSGNKNITKFDYDDKNPLGCSIINGEIIEMPSIINASNKYLLESVNIEKWDKTKINFSNVIFEEDESFMVKMLVLADKSAVLDITPIGKVSGVKEIEVVENTNKELKTGLWESLTYGSLLIHSVRFIFYIIIITLLLIIIIVPIINISDAIGKKRRKKLVNSFKKYSKSNYEKLSESYKYILELYAEQGEEPIRTINKILIGINESKVLSLIKKVNQETISDGSLIRHRDEIYYREHMLTDEINGMPYFRGYNRLVIKRMIENHYIIIENDNVKLDEKFNKCFIKFYDYMDMYCSK